MNALDLSFSARYVTPKWCRRRIAEGYELLIVDAWTGKQSPAGVEQVLRYWREAGGLTAAYYVPHALSPAQWHFDHLRAACGAEWGFLHFVALDVEDIGESELSIQFTHEHLVQSIQLVREAGATPWIYTSRFMWTALLGDFSWFDKLCLWDADYNGLPTLDLLHPYGGWTWRGGHQYQGMTDLEGIAVDLSIFGDALVVRGEPPESPETHALGTIWGWAEVLESGVSLRRKRKGQMAKELKDAVRILKGEEGGE